MITVTLNRTEFEYDIHSLIKAFFPKEDVELYYTKEAHADEKMWRVPIILRSRKKRGVPIFRLIMRMTEFPSPGMTRRMVRRGAPLRWIFQSYRDKECIEGTSVPPAGGRDGTAAAMGYTDRYPSDEDSDADA